LSDARLSTKADSKIVVERLLSVSGEDSLTIDRKYREPWTGRLLTRFVIMSNELPRLSDSSGALASRFILFVLTKSFYGSENPKLTGELLAEAPAIFNWALEGLDRLNQRGYFVNPESGNDAIQQMEDLSSPIGTTVPNRRTGWTNTTQRTRVWSWWSKWSKRFANVFPTGEWR
jgi:putative DNA primase/helicase